MKLHSINETFNKSNKNYDKNIHNYLLCLCLLLLLLLTGCSNSKNRDGSSAEEVPFITKSDFLLNTVVTINLYDKQDEKLLQECFELIKKYENIYSRTSESSELYALNHGTAPHKGLTYQISDELSDIFKYGLYYSKLSGGAFDISVAPLTSLWNFITDEPKLPKQEDILAALPFVNYEYIQLNKKEVTFTKEGVAIDLGAIAKGYIADRLKELLISKGVKSAMINLGGNVLCVGEKPKGIPFHVGIQKPFAGRNETVAVMEINDLSVVSSGIYERCFTLDGVTYHHILDPKTGYPYDNSLVSVTIISNKSMDGDGLSTTCFALGLDKGLELIASLPDTYAVFITKDYEIFYSKGFEDAIKLLD
jgi:thiamine biosynthesis lipoprotein